MNEKKDEQIGLVNWQQIRQNCNEKMTKTNLQNINTKKKKNISRESKANIEIEKKTYIIIV